MQKWCEPKSFNDVPEKRSPVEDADYDSDATEIDNSYAVSGEFTENVVNLGAACSDSDESEKGTLAGDADYDSDATEIDDSAAVSGECTVFDYFSF